MLLQPEERKAFIMIDAAMGAEEELRRWMEKGLLMQHLRPKETNLIPGTAQRE